MNLRKEFNNKFILFSKIKSITHRIKWFNYCFRRKINTKTKRKNTNLI